MMSFVAFLLLTFASKDSSQLAKSEGTGFLIEVQGDVSLQRLAWLRPWPAPLGVELRAGDTVRLKGNATARILCQDLLNSWQPTQHTVSGVFQGCPAKPETIRQRAGQDALDVRTTESQPTVRTPSNTVILDPTPWIQWEAVPHINRYRVAVFDIRSPSRPIWAVLVNGTSTRYIGTPPLTVGSNYFVRVRADGGLSADGRTFSIASQELRRGLEERKHRLQASIPGGEALELATALYLLSEDLRSDALVALDGLVGTGERPALQLLRARVFEEIGVKDAALRALRAGLQEADKHGYPEIEAEAHLGLARLALTHGEAVQQSRRAAQIFRELGDTARAQATEEVAHSKGN